MKNKECTGKMKKRSIRFLGLVLIAALLCGACVPAMAECDHSGGVYSSFDWKTESAPVFLSNWSHVIKGSGIVTLWCVDCGAIVKQYESTLQRRDMHNYDENGICTGCGHKNGCKHEDTYTGYDYDYDNDYSLTDNRDGRTHTVTIAKGYKTLRCNICGMIISETYFSTPYTYKENHWFNGNEPCSCGAVNPSTCAHLNTYTDGYVDGWQYDSVVTPLNATFHQVTGRASQNVYCADCGANLKWAESTEVETREENHYFEGGICYLCGYVNTCTHPNTVYDSYIEGNPEYISITGTTHTARGTLSVTERCTQCNQVISRQRVENYTKTDRHGYNNNGICYNCGYDASACTHPTTEVYNYIYSDEATYTPLNETSHQKSGPAWAETVCAVCGKYLDSVYDHQVAGSEVEDHVMVNGKCIYCGYTKATQQEVEPTEAIKSFVKRCYQLFFNRTPAEGEYSGWAKLLANKQASASEIISGFTRSDEFTNQNPSNSDVVEVLYQTMMDRPSDAGGKAGWTSYLDNGCSDSLVINGFCGSAEFSAICAEYGIEAGGVANEVRDINPSVTAFVNRCYLESLGRAGEAAGLNGWVGLLLDKQYTPKEVAHGFVFSQEMENRQLSNRDWVITMYRLYMGREPAEGEYDGWVSLLDSGVDKEVVNSGFADSPEFAAIVAGYGL